MSGSSQPSLVEFDLVLTDGDGTMIDPHGRAFDLTTAGFRAETRAPLIEGQVAHFEVSLSLGERAVGRGVVVWTNPDARGWYSAGVKITKLAWADRRRIRQAVSEQGYDFVLLARNLFWALYWIVVAVGVHNLLYHQQLTLQVLLKLVPIAAALLVAGWAVLTLVK